jgi:ribosomal protein S18 acetylase RimI-like enzyme
MNAMPALAFRTATEQDYDRIAPVLQGWWGRPVLTSLPRLFLEHFHRTSFIAELDAAPEPGLAGFLIGLLSPSQPDRAHIHFVGVAPEYRGAGLGRTLYGLFFDLARADGRQRVTAVTSPVNQGSIDFHRRMGFTVTGPVADHDGPGHDLMLFSRPL